MPKSLHGSSRAASVLALSWALTLSGCGGGGGGTISPTPLPTATPTASVTCPTSGSLPTAVAFGTSAESVRRAVPAWSQAERYVPGQIAVTYSGEAPALEGQRVAELHYPGRALRTRIVSVDPANVDAAITRLRSMPGVQDVARVTYRHRMAITADDPYYVGAPGTIAPYYETASTHGQWDMHAIKLDGAWSQFTASPVIGASIAVVDTGADVTHPELITPAGVTAPKIVRTQCYVTYPAGTAQTTGTYVTDTDGHGTNVTGLADGDSNNSFGFAGAAFDARMLVYRIFPTTPSAGCSSNSTDPQCSASSADEASAINDAVSNGAKVINLSLGAAPPCPTNDPEYVAVENAIAHGVAVVAAAGNESRSSLDCPAQDPGVIAVGASALNDTNPAAITEYVPSYSNWTSTSAQPGGGAYLVAPGGDPASSTDPDNLHWIQNIYSTTAYDAAKRSSCTGGLDNFGETGDCNVEIAGTSMSTPHVTGVVSLMLAKNSKLTPAQIATGLCTTAVSIGDSKQGCGRVDASAAVTWAATH